MRWFTGFFGLDINLDYKDNLTVTKLDFLGRRLFDVETYSFNKDCVDSWIFDIARSEHGSKDFNYWNTERKIYNIFSNKKNDAFFYNGLKYVSNYFYNRPFFFQARTGNRKHKLSAAFYKHVLYDDAISYIGQRLHGLAFKQYLPWEFLWLVGPTLVVYVILSPSVWLLYASDDYNMVYPKLTYKVIGHQWYWEYQFIKQYIVTSHSSWSKSIQAKSLLDYSTGNSQITNYAHDRLYPNPRIGHYFVHMGHKVYDLFSNNVALENLVKGTKRLLTTNNAIIIPCNQTLRFMITSDDVLHAWGIPDLAIKMDAVPGRLNSFNALVTRPGVYFGSCFELCGVYHGFMPIMY
jgi:heme/copper-type cytochrome/quinol oxidase subunit 2